MCVPQITCEPTPYSPAFQPIQTSLIRRCLRPNLPRRHHHPAKRKMPACAAISYPRSADGIGDRDSDRLGDDGPARKQGINPYTIPDRFRPARHRHDDTWALLARAAGAPLLSTATTMDASVKRALSKSAFAGARAMSHIWRDPGRTWFAILACRSLLRDGIDCRTAISARPTGQNRTFACSSGPRRSVSSRDRHHDCVPQIFLVRLPQFTGLFMLAGLSELGCLSEYSECHSLPMGSGCAARYRRRLSS